MAGEFDRVLGQPLCPAQRHKRLPGPAPGHAPSYDRGRATCLRDATNASDGRLVSRADRRLRLLYAPAHRARSPTHLGSLYAPICGMPVNHRNTKPAADPRCESCCPPRNRWFAHSPPEGTGFELWVPRETGLGSDAKLHALLEIDRGSPAVECEPATKRDPGQNSSKSLKSFAKTPEVGVPIGADRAPSDAKFPSICQGVEAYPRWGPASLLIHIRAPIWKADSGHTLPVRPWNGSGPGSPPAATSASRPR